MAMRSTVLAATLAAVCILSTGAFANSDMGDGSQTGSGVGEGNGHPRHRPDGGGRMRPRRGGVEIGVYGRGRIGPPTACEELAQLSTELERLWQIRAQIAAGNTLIRRDSHGRPQVVDAQRVRRSLDAQTSLAGIMYGSDSFVTGHRYVDANMEALQARSLTAVEAQIGRTQDRIAQLRYECNE